MTPTLILIGPAASGKTTVGELAAKALACEFVDIDQIAEPYYAEVGWSLERLASQVERVGRYQAEIDWEEARLHATRCALDQHPGAVLAMGAGHTTYSVPSHQQAIGDVLRSARRVVYLVPFADRDASLLELRRRSRRSKQTDWISGGHDFLAGWLDDPVPRALASHILYTGDRPMDALVEDLTAIASPTTGSDGRNAGHFMAPIARPGH